MANEALKERILKGLRKGPVSADDHTGLMLKLKINPRDYSKRRFKRALGCLAHCEKHGIRIRMSRERQENITSDYRPYTLMPI